MANETSSTSMNDVFVTVLHQGIVEERRPNTIPVHELHTRADPVGRGITTQFALQADPGAAAGLTETTDAANTQLTDTNQQATATEQGIMATVTDRLAKVSVVDAYGHFGSVLGRSYQERLNDIFCGMYDDFSNTTGTSGSDFTLIQFIAAVSALRGREVPGPYYGVLHNQQLLDLQSGSGNTPGGLLPGFGANQTGMDYLSSGKLNENLLNNLQPGNGPFQLADVTFFTTTSVVTANAGADRAGAIFNKEAIGYHELWDQRTELQRDASLRATEIVVTGCIGAVEVDDNRGQSIITDA